MVDFETRREALQYTMKAGLTVAELAETHALRIAPCEVRVLSYTRSPSGRLDWCAFLRFVSAMERAAPVTRLPDSDAANSYWLF